MARKEPKAENFSDIADAPMPTGGFANIAPPPQQLIDQAVAGQPNTEEVVVMGRPERRATVAPVAVAQPVMGQRRPAQEIINAFLNEISGHPDLMILSSSLGGRPDKATEFANTPKLNQHKGELRFVWRDPQPEMTVREAADQRAAYQPGGKYFDLIPKRGEVDPETVSVPNDGPKPWDNIIKKREMAEAV